MSREAYSYPLAPGHNCRGCESLGRQAGPSILAFKEKLGSKCLSTYSVQCQSVEYRPSMELEAVQQVVPNRALQ